jgi:hypothetical protein
MVDFLLRLVRFETATENKRQEVPACCGCPVEPKLLLQAIPLEFRTLLHDDIDMNFIKFKLLQN